MKKLSELNVGFWIHEKALVRTELGWEYPHKLTKKEYLMVCNIVDGQKVISLVQPKCYYKLPYNGELYGTKLFSDSEVEIEVESEFEDDLGRKVKKKTKLKTDKYSGNIMFKPSDKIVKEDKFEVSNFIDKRTYNTRKVKYNGFLYGFDISPIVSFEFKNTENVLDYCIIKK